MKKLIAFILLFISTFNLAFADCDWSKDITPGPNHTFIYSDACHLAVGQLIQTNKTQTAQIADLTKAIQLKDLAITNADARIALWTTTAENEQDRISKIDSMQKTNDFLYFGLGILATIGTGFAVARLVK